MRRPQRRRAKRDDRGAVATELAIVMPMLIVLVFLPMQFALYWHGKQAASLAAEECANAAAEYGNGHGDGSAAARSILGEGGNLTGVSIKPSGGDTVSCTVSGALSFTIIGEYTVESTATATRERFVTP